jgi:hypothetical protein
VANGWPVYSVRFFAVEGLTDPYIITIPDGYVGIVRCLTMFWNGDVAGDVYLVGANAETVVYFGATLADGPPRYFTWEGRYVVWAGDTIEVYGSADPVDVTVSGYLIAGAPPSSSFAMVQARPKIDAAVADPRVA